MSTARDYLSAAPVYARLAANRARVRASNAWHRAAGRRIQGGRARFSNWRNRRTLERGRAPRLTGARAAVASRTPVYRNRINRAHGNKHREDARLHRLGNEGLKRMKAARPEQARHPRRGRRFPGMSLGTPGRAREYREERAGVPRTRGKGKSMSKTRSWRDRFAKGRGRAGKAYHQVIGRHVQRRRSRAYVARQGRDPAPVGRVPSPARVPSSGRAAHVVPARSRVRRPGRTGRTPR